ncbi:hypothetical protein HNP84_002494 [Thermocatellispora tengchongensis]|uniref:Helix-turn-helix domain-containing protein n=2 Tax=Thermocatellispora tengchongensis TaxID=1073253 RepID=A0A840P4E1_9ACTN|nr:hypothetical protein [Thermocatellispora tengchongensis]MBB5132773.1 hypothetical protein [Thermocatellispora tengchongensis]
MRRAPSQQDFRRAVKEHPDAFALKCHAYRNLTEVADALANWADWTTMTTRPTEQRIADDLDLALSTVKRWIRWLRERGFLGVVEEGTTNRYRRGNRCGLGDDGLGNRAAVWVLCVPAPELDEHDARTDKTTTEPPSCTSRRGVQEGPTRAREERSSSRRRNRISTTGELAATPGTRRHERKQALQVAEKIHDESTTLRRLSPWYIRHLIRDYVTAGWTADDVMHALDHKPDGSAWTYTWTSRDQIRNVPGWVRFRLSAWLDEHGRPLPGKSQRLAAAAAELRAEQVRMRERFALAGVASASYSDQAARARELLVRSSPAAARAMRVRGREAARPREAGDERRWGRIDQQAREEIARRPRLVEALPLVEQPVVDEVAERRRVSLARARMRARAHRQNDKS